MIELGSISMETKGGGGIYYDNPCEPQLGRSQYRTVCP